MDFDHFSFLCVVHVLYENLPNRLIFTGMRHTMDTILRKLTPMWSRDSVLNDILLFWSYSRKDSREMAVI